MIRRSVVYAPEALGDLTALYEWIADQASPETALAYVERLRAYLNGFDIAAERGTRRDDIRPGLRVVGFERRITIAFVPDDARVVILRLFYGGMNWTEAV